jgi:hypothetical protein
MQPLYNDDQFNISKNFDKLPLRCLFCNSVFLRTKHRIRSFLNKNRSETGDFCSRNCKDQFLSKKLDRKVSLTCKTCSSVFLKYKSKISKTGNDFCSSSCSALYNNKLRKTGTRISKLEMFIQSKLISMYPNMEIFFNKKDIIDSELDIYIPSIQVAFELNGIVHYKPIYGEEKLAQIKNNDKRKLQICSEKQIKLFIIDTSHQKYFKESSSQQFLKFITDLVNSELSRLNRVEVL